MQYPMIAQPQYAFAPTMMAGGGVVDAARTVQSRGRGNDTMLVHMTPKEVGGLQTLAMAHGGSLSINPKTGLPEAGFLEDLLPTLIGAALTIGSGGAIDPATAGMIVGGGTTIATGDLGAGIMAGLGAYGGAGTGAGLQAAGAAGSATSGIVGSPEALAAQTAGNQSAAEAARLTAANQVAGVNAPPPTIAENFSQAGRGLKNLVAGQEGAFTKFIGTPGRDADARKGIDAVQATGLGGSMGALKTAGALYAPSLFAQPNYAPPKKEESGYEGPYKPTTRMVSYPTDEERRRTTSEYMYFSPSNPIPFAEGGDVSPISMSTPEAQVYSQIANIQNLAGLPAIDTSRFNIIPSKIDRTALVYNPIEYRPTEGGTDSTQNLAEQDYGFKSLSSDIKPGGTLSQDLGPQSALFFKPAKSYYDPFAIAPKKDKKGNLLLDEYRQAYTQFVPGTSINMANWEYDPFLGGYREARNLDYAKGGSVPQLESGGFVLTKKAVDGLGKGDNKRGQKVASRGLGAIPIKGPGTGTSDSIKTTIDGKTPARIANGESYVPRKEVERRGGAKKFYALMKKAERRA